MVTEIHDRLRSNVEEVRARIAAAAERAGRAADAVTLVAVTKTVGIDVVRQLLALGLRDFGENRPVAAAAKIDALGPEPRWHMIGHLQRNKVSKVVGEYGLLHSIDSMRLAEAVDAAAERAGCDVEGLLQVNISGESAKGGFSPAGLLETYEQCRTLSRLRVRGFMTMAPFVDDAESVRPVFRALRELRDDVLSRHPDARSLGLSMGMTRDFEVAIEEGADWIRVGTALFEGVSPTASSGPPHDAPSEPER